MDVKVVVDDRELELNRYVKSIFFEVNKAMINTLRGIENWSRAEIIIEG